jgi:hypothetical protein
MSDYMSAMTNAMGEIYQLRAEVARLTAENKSLEEKWERDIYCMGQCGQLASGDGCSACLAERSLALKGK